MPEINDAGICFRIGFIKNLILHNEMLWKDYKEAKEQIEGKDAKIIELENQVESLKKDSSNLVNTVVLGGPRAGKTLALRVKFLEAANAGLLSEIQKLEANPTEDQKTIARLKKEILCLEGKFNERKGTIDRQTNEHLHELNLEVKRLKGENKHLSESVEVLKERKEKIRLERNEWKNFCLDIFERGNWIATRYLRLDGDESMGDLFHSLLDGILTLEQKWSVERL